MLDIAGVNYHKHYVSLLRGETSSPAFLKLNPQGKVPCLQIGNEFLVESASLIRFVASAFNLTELYPTDFRQRAKVDEILETWSTSLLNKLEIAYYRTYVGIAWFGAKLLPHWEEKRIIKEANDAI